MNQKDLILHEKLLEYEDSIDTIIKLNEIGFNSHDSSSLYNKYKSKVLDIINDNIYDLIDEEFTYRKIDVIALKQGYERLDKRRIKASILYVFDEIINTLGDKYIVI